MTRLLTLFCASLTLSAISPSSLIAADASAPGVKITELDDKLHVELNGTLFTEYVFRGAPHVFFYPLLGPGGLPMTRNWPMKRDVVGEAKDHPHHRSLWYSHGAVNGVDFWTEGAKTGKILHDRFLEIKSCKDEGLIRAACNWVAPDGKVSCTDERVFRVYARPNNERLFDYEITLKAPADKNLVLGDTKEGSMAVRIAETMRLAQPNRQKGEGHIVLSTGVRDGGTWGKAAAWCDYYGPVQGKTAGIAIFDHPSNPRHPTTWHVRDYGLFAANPFGIHDFTNRKQPAGAGNLTVPAGKSVTFKYRFYLHEGDEKQAKVADRYQEYAAGAK